MAKEKNKDKSKGKGKGKVKVKVKDAATASDKTKAKEKDKTKTKVKEKDKTKAKEKDKTKAKAKEKDETKAKVKEKDKTKAKVKEKDKTKAKVKEKDKTKAKVKASRKTDAADGALLATRGLVSTPEPAFPKALRHEHFKERPALSHEFVRSIETWLEDSEFHDKAVSIWPQGAWLTVRAHPAAMWADLAQLDPQLLPGREGVCLGDAHFDNFGFIQLPGQTSYLFGPNDLDDGGVGPVALDALKYFAVLGDQPRLQGYLDILIERYVSALRDPRLEQRVPRHLWPNPAEVASKKLSKYVANSKIRPEALPFKTKPVGEQLLSFLKDALQTCPQLRGSVLLDAVDQYKLAGGSYGDARHWVLIDRGAKRGLDLIEFKTMTPAAASFGPLSRPMTQWQRIQFLKRELWHTDSNADYFVARLAGRDFLVRSRLHKATLAPLELTDTDDLDDVLEAQVSILAALHRPFMTGVPHDRLTYWLHESAEILSTRWSQMISAAQDWLAPKTPPATRIARVRRARRRTPRRTIRS